MYRTKVVFPVREVVPTVDKFAPRLRLPEIPTPPEKSAEPVVALVLAVVFVLEKTPFMVTAPAVIVPVNVLVLPTESVVPIFTAFATPKPPFDRTRVPEEVFPESVAFERTIKPLE